MQQHSSDGLRILLALGDSDVVHPMQLGRAEDVVPEPERTADVGVHGKGHAHGEQSVQEDRFLRS